MSGADFDLSGKVAVVTGGSRGLVALTWYSKQRGVIGPRTENGA